MFHKKIREKSNAVLELVRARPCLACPTNGQRHPTEADHITTRGAGGGDVQNNVWPLCTKHHRMRHEQGLMLMVSCFPACAKWLVDHERMDILDAVTPL